MEPEGSLPHSKVPTTCPYPEPTPSSPHNPLPLPEDPSYYYPPIYVWVSPMVSFPQVSSSKPYIHLSSPPYVLHPPAHLIFLDFIARTILSERYGSLSSSFCSILHSSVTLPSYILLSALFSNTLSLRNFFKVVLHISKTFARSVN